jgi:hypothetical protein
MVFDGSKECLLWLAPLLETSSSLLVMHICIDLFFGVDDCQAQHATLLLKVILAARRTSIGLLLWTIKVDFRVYLCCTHSDYVDQRHKSL